MGRAARAGYPAQHPAAFGGRLDIFAKPGLGFVISHAFALGLRPADAVPRPQFPPQTAAPRGKNEPLGRFRFVPNPTTASVLVFLIARGLPPKTSTTTSYSFPGHRLGNLHVRQITGLRRIRKHLEDGGEQPCENRLITTKSKVELLSYCRLVA